MTSFIKYEKLFKNNKISEMTDEKSLLWLKLRSISRKEILLKFVTEISLFKNGEKINGKKLFETIFEKCENESKNYSNQIDIFIKNNLNILSEKDEQKLVSELYKLKFFDWGGDYKNNLDRFLVDRFIKKIPSFDGIKNALDFEIKKATDGYVQCSWYNHWSTIVIENIFKNHSKIISAIGQVKQIDFFLDDIPFDLKVTYLPVNFIEQKRKEKKLRTEFAVYKSIAKKYKITFNLSSKNEDIIYEIREKIYNTKDTAAIAEIEEINDFRKKVLDECIKNPRELIYNLYEQQGQMRFDASNRLFLILIDKNNFEDSWKLKRDTVFLKKIIFDALNKFDKNRILKNPIKFKYDEKDYKSFADVIFVIK